MASPGDAYPSWRRAVSLMTTVSPSGSFESREGRPAHAPLKRTPRQRLESVEFEKTDIDGALMNRKTLPLRNRVGITTGLRSGARNEHDAERTPESALTSSLNALAQAPRISSTWSLSSRKLSCVAKIGLSIQNSRRHSQANQDRELQDDESLPQPFANRSDRRNDSEHPSRWEADSTTAG